MTVRQLVSQLEALKRPDAEVIVYLEAHGRPSVDKVEPRDEDGEVCLVCEE